MNITIVGYGKMGKEIDRLAAGRGITVVGRLDIDSTIGESEVQKTDVAIHFASSESVLPSVLRWSAAKKNIVVGTTGWQSDFEKVRSVITEKGTGLVYASNFSVGVHIFYRLVREAAQLIDKFPEYDVTIHEQHHGEDGDRREDQTAGEVGVHSTVPLSLRILRSE